MNSSSPPFVSIKQYPTIPIYKPPPPGTFSVSTEPTSTNSFPQNKVYNNQYGKQESSPSNRTPRPAIVTHFQPKFQNRFQGNTSNQSKDTSYKGKGGVNDYFNETSSRKPQSKKPEVPPLPKLSEFERRLRNIRILLGIEQTIQKSESGKTFPPKDNSSEQSVDEELLQFLCSITAEYHTKKEAATSSREIIELDIQYYKDSFTHVFSILGLEGVSLTTNTIHFLTEYTKKAEEAVLQIENIAGPYYNQSLEIRSSIFPVRRGKQTIPDPLWDTIPGVKCVFLPIDTQEGPQEIEIKPYPRTKKDLELFFEKRGSFSSINGENGDFGAAVDVQFQLFVVTRSRPIVAFRTSMGQPRFTKSNKLVEKWINDNRVKKFFGPVVLFKIFHHDPETDELEIGNYTIKEFDKKIDTNFSPEELVGVTCQLKQVVYPPRMPPKQESLSRFKLDTTSFEKVLVDFKKKADLPLTDWSPLFYHTARLDESTSCDQVNLLRTLANIVKSSLKYGAYIKSKGYLVVNLNFVSKELEEDVGDNYLYVLLEEFIVGKSINMCVFGAIKRRSQDEKLGYRAQFIGTWKEIMTQCQDKELLPPPFCLYMMNHIDLRKKNMTLKPRLNSKLGEYDTHIPSRLSALSKKELRMLFTAIYYGMEQRFLEEDRMTIGLIDNTIKYFIPLQYTEKGKQFYDGAVVLDIVGTTFTGSRICSIDEAFVAIHSISGSIKTWIDRVSSNMLQLDMQRDEMTDSNICNLRNKILINCHRLRVDTFYMNVDKENSIIQVMFRHNAIPIETRNTISTNEFNTPKRMYVEMKKYLETEASIPTVSLLEVELMSIDRSHFSRFEVKFSSE